MNPITNMKNLNKMNDRELEMGLTGTKNSWHAQVKVNDNFNFISLCESFSCMKLN